MDMRDGYFIKEKLTSKEAKDLYDTHLKLEKDYKHLFNGKFLNAWSF